MSAWVTNGPHGFLTGTVCAQSLCEGQEACGKEPWAPSALSTGGHLPTQPQTRVLGPIPGSRAPGLRSGLLGAGLQPGPASGVPSCHLPCPGDAQAGGTPEWAGRGTREGGTQAGRPQGPTPFSAPRPTSRGPTFSNTNSSSTTYPSGHTDTDTPSTLLLGWDLRRTDGRPSLSGLQLGPRLVWTDPVPADASPLLTLPPSLSSQIVGVRAPRLPTVRTHT